MGAPADHPFFGNQHTDGGYKPGSYSYKDDLERTARTATESFLSKSSNDLSYDTLTEASPSDRSSSGSMATLIVVGSAVLVVGVALFRHLRGRSKNAGEQASAGGDSAGFGLCESCGKELATTGLAELERDEHGYYIICESCSHKNRAHYSDGEVSDISDKQ